MLAFAVFFSSCSKKNPSELDPKIIQQLKQLYRASSLVVIGNASAIAQSTDSCTLGNLSVLSGGTVSNTYIKCIGATCEPNSFYLMFLLQTETTDEYSVLNSFKVLNGSVLFNELSIPVESITVLLNNFASEILLPSHTYYFSSLDALANACDVIFVGRVENFPPVTMMHCYSESNGVSVENEAEASRACITVLGAIKGEITYGIKLDFIYMPSMVNGMLDNSSLAPVTYNVSSVPPLKAESTYVFFMIKSDDVKQDLMFAINPIQGYIELDGEKLITSSNNICISSYSTLSQLVLSIRAHVY